MITVHPFWKRNTASLTSGRACDIRVRHWFSSLSQSGRRLLLGLAILAAMQVLLRVLLLFSFGIIGVSGLAVHSLVLLSLTVAGGVAVTRYRSWIAGRPLYFAFLAAGAGIIHASSLIIDIVQAAYLTRDAAILPLGGLISNPDRFLAILDYLSINPAGLLAVIAAVELVFIILYCRASAEIVRAGRRHAIVLQGADAVEKRSRRDAGDLLLLGGALTCLGTIVLTPSLAIRDPYINMILAKERMAPDALLYDAGRTNAAWAGAGEPPLEHPRPLILIVVDSLRADAVHRNMPLLSAAVTSGRFTQFKHAFSTCTYSICGIMSALTGRYWEDFGVAPPVLPDLLKPYGYDSYFVLAGDHSGFAGLRRLYGPNLTAFVDDTIDPERKYDDDNLIPRLRRLTIREPARSFLYIHLMSAHEGSYVQERPAATFSEKLLRLVDPQGEQRRYRAQYDAGVRKADRVIHDLLAELQQMGLTKDAIIIVTADHGERLGPGRRLGHGGNPDWDTLSIPLLLHLPNGEQLDTQAIVSTVDIAPTFLDMISVDRPPGLNGRSLRQTERGNTAPVGTEKKRGAIIQTSGGFRLDLDDR